MPSEVLLFACVIAVISLIGLITRLRGRDPHAVSQQGQIIAVVVHFDRGFRWRGNPDPLSLGPVIRTADGTEVLGRRVTVTAMPRSVRRQIFTHASIINEFSPNLALGAEEKRAALDQARHGGYRMELTEPLPVSFERRRDGSHDWRPA